MDYRCKYQVQCEEPVVIMNPNYYRLLKRCTHFVTPAGKKRITEQDIADVYKGKNQFVPALYNLRKVLKDLDVQSKTTFNKVLKEYYLTDGKDLHSMFYLVPCGKCILCANKKSSEWSDRCMMETESHKSLPIFITLTYDEPSLKTYCSNGVDVRHCQLFFKNLRKRLPKEVKIRYLLCSEYGSKFHRPHYHIVLWGYPLVDDNDSPSVKMANEKTRFEALCNIVGLHGSVNYSPFKRDGKHFHLRTSTDCYDPQHKQDYTSYAWKYGHVDLQQCYDGNASKYVTKYLFKKKERPVKFIDESTGEIEYFNKCFMLCSRGNGGIGFPFLKSMIEDIRRFPLQQTFCFPSIHQHTQQEVYFSTYLGRKIFPALSNSIDVYFRNTLDEIAETLHKSNIRFNNAQFQIDHRCPYQLDGKSGLDNPYDFNPTEHPSSAVYDNLLAMIQEYNMKFYEDVLPNLDLYLELDAKSQLRHLAVTDKECNIVSRIATIREHEERRSRSFDKYN